MGMPRGFLINSLSLSLSLDYLEARDNFLNEPKGFWIASRMGKNLNEHGVIDTIKELFDVCPPDETSGIDCQEFLSAINSGDEPLACPARPRVKDKSFVVNRHDVIVKQAVNHAVANGGHRDDALFIVAHGECSVDAMSVSSVIKIFVEFQQIPLQIVLKMIQFPAGFFNLTESRPAVPNTA